ncbi:hypothetical protein SAMN04488137_4519 [Fictibacillus solisalsi]|uniref:Uncharacterized protein n=1 Tax=Fictibacillus solisalsi TaxID=459525 RepID=A0A1H0BK81_9BACL|nr:hypothetical protein [Fictibacillus solisalsi]SDN45813.1 hypothetical protein SAMN04488137_4519 [Fictibacillus solisalsi]
METENKVRGYIRVGHLVYIIIIAVIVLAFFLVYAFGGSENANTTIGTASTVSSLILSVIAIVMTLIDVAGQRQSIMDLKETAEKLEESNVSAGNLIKDLITQIADLQDTREQMVNSVVGIVTETMNEVKEGNDRQKKLLENIKSLVENEKYDDVKRIIENAKTDEIELPNMANIIPEMKVHKMLPQGLYDKAKKHLRSNFRENHAFMHDEFMRYLSLVFFRESRSNLNHLYLKLLKDNLIKESLTPTGDIEITLNKKLFM